MLRYLLLHKSRPALITIKNIHWMERETGNSSINFLPPSLPPFLLSFLPLSFFLSYLPVFPPFIPPLLSFNSPSFLPSFIICCMVIESHYVFKAETFPLFQLLFNINGNSMPQRSSSSEGVNSRVSQAASLGFKFQFSP